MILSFTMALRYLAGRRLRTALTTLAVVFGVAVVFAGNLALPAVIESLRRTMLLGASTADLVVTSVTGESFSAAGALEIVSVVPGVQAASGQLRRQVTLPAGVAENQQIELVGLDPLTAEMVRPLRITDGRPLQAGDSGVVLLPASMGSQVGVGAVLPLPTSSGLRPFTVIGLLVDPGGLSTPQVTMTLADAQAALAQPGLVNAIEVALAPGADRDAVLAAVLRALGDGFQAGETGGNLSMLSSIQVGYAVFNLLGALALFIGGFLIYNTFRTIVVERRHDLAMMRALGAERRQLTGMILMESLVQGVAGTSLGLLLGYGFTVGLVSSFNQYIPQFAPGLRVDIGFSPQALVMAVALGLLATLVAGYLPARAAGRVSPLEALRPEAVQSVQRAARWSLGIGGVVVAVAVALLAAGPGSGAIGALLFLAGLVVAVPGLVTPLARLLGPLLTLWFAAEGDVARGNVTRQPDRAAITASTLMVGLAVFVISAATVSSLSAYVTALFRHNFASDIMLMPQSLLSYSNNLGASGDLAERLSALPQVETVGTLRHAMAFTGGKAVPVFGIDPVAQPKVSPLDFTKGEAGAAYAALTEGRTAIANPALAASLGLKPGDNLVLQTAEGQQTYRIVAVGGDALTLKMSVLFISQANLRSDFHKSDDIMLLVKLKAGADLTEARQAIQAIAADYPQFTLSVTADYRETLSQESLSSMNLFYLMALIILLPASLGLLNTLTINVLERRREIAMVRAVGGSRRQVRRMVTAEALLLGLFGAALGIIAGVVTSYGFLAAFRGALGWRLPYAFPLAGALSALVIAIVVALFAAILPARNAAKLDIIKALQYE